MLRSATRSHALMSSHTPMLRHLTHCLAARRQQTQQQPHRSLAATAAAGGGGRMAGKTAIVTGAAHGIGKATATLFAEQGANVIVSAPPSPPLPPPLPLPCRPCPCPAPAACHSTTPLCLPQLADRDAETGEAVASLLRARGDSATFVETDVSSEAAVANLIEVAAGSGGGKIDALINVAGVDIIATLEDTEPDRWVRAHPASAHRQPRAYD